MHNIFRLSKPLAKNWQSVRLGDTVDFVGGSQPPKSNFRYSEDPDYVRFVQIRDYKSSKNLTYIPKALAKRWCSKDDIMIARYGPPIFQILRGIEGSYNVALMKCVPRAEIHSEFLFQLLKQQTMLRFVESHSERTAGQTGVNLKLLNECLIPLPPLEDQVRIATVLTRAEQLIAKRKESIQALDELLKSTFLKMFGAPLRMRSLPHTNLAELIIFLTSGSRGWAKYYSDKGAVFIRINNVRDAFLKLDDLIYVDAPENAEATRTRVQENDLLFSITADLGRTAVVPKQLAGAYVNQHLAIIRLRQDAINPIYAAWYFAMPYGKALVARKNREAVKAGLNFDDIRGFQIVIPPLSLQNQFAAIVEKIEALKAKYQQSLVELENLYGSLSQRAFKGELDLSRVRV